MDNTVPQAPEWIKVVAFVWFSVLTSGAIYGIYDTYTTHPINMLKIYSLAGSALFYGFLVPLCAFDKTKFYQWLLNDKTGKKYFYSALVGALAIHLITGYIYLNSID